VRISNGRSGAELGRQVIIADGWWSRTVGLLGRSALPEGEGILLSPCGSIHTVGLRFPIDVAFLDALGRIVASRHAVAPGRLAFGGESAEATLELPAGTLAATDTHDGDVLIVEEVRA
jgi:uncharacterized membrane protein (UPF0127 family)